MAVVTAVDGLAALLDEAEALDEDGIPHECPPLRHGCPTCEYEASHRWLVAALRPFAAPVGVEAFEGLRREHDPGVTWGAGCIRAIHPKGRAKCTCGADAHNTLLDQCIAAHVAALGEVERVKAEMATARMVTLPGWTEPMDIDHAIGVMEESANVRIAALRSAILDGPDPTEKACPRCGLVMCDRERLGNVPLAEMTREQGIAAMQAFNEAELDCYTRPAVDWRAQLAKLREVAR